jgi:hypothetical protein
MPDNNQYDLLGAFGKALLPLGGGAPSGYDPNKLSSLY